MGSGLFQLRGVMYNTPTEQLQVGAPLRGVTSFTQVLTGPVALTVPVVIPLGTQLILTAIQDAILIEALVVEVTSDLGGVGILSLGAGLFILDGAGNTTNIPIAQSTATGLNVPPLGLGEVGNGLVAVLQPYSPLVLAEDIHRWAGNAGAPAGIGYPLGIVSIVMTAALTLNAGTATTKVLGRFKIRKVSGVQEG